MYLYNDIIYNAIVSCPQIEVGCVHHWVYWDNANISGITYIMIFLSFKFLSLNIFSKGKVLKLNFASLF